MSLIFFRDLGGQCRIVSGIVFSDYAPVMVSFKQRRRYTNISFKIPGNILLDNSFHMDVCNIWSASMEGSDALGIQVANALMNLTSFFRGMSKKAQESARVKELASRQFVSSLQRLQERYPSCTCVQECLMHSKLQLQHINKTIWRLYFSILRQRDGLERVIRLRRVSF